MENTPVVDEAVAPKKSILFEVTPLSKTLTVILLIMLPFVGFWIGTLYSKTTNNVVQTAITPATQDQVQTPQYEEPSKVNENTPERLDLPQNSALLSAKTGVFKGYLSKKVLSNDEVQGNVALGETITCDTFTITEGDLSIFYKNTAEDTYTPLAHNELPYEIYIGDGDIKTLPQNTQNALLKSSPTTPVFAVITEYVSSGGKGLDTCESEVEIFNAL